MIKKNTKEKADQILSEKKDAKKNIPSMGSKFHQAVNALKNKKK